MRYIQKFRKSLRTRFKKEYLIELVNIEHRKNSTIQVRGVVLSGSDNTKRINWPCRVARVKAEKGQLVRPFQRFYPMEISGAHENFIFDKLEDTKQSEANHRIQEKKRTIQKPNFRLK